MLQREEAELVLIGASARTLRERPKITFGTVPDAIVYDEEHTPSVKGGIEDDYHRGIGVMPRIRIGGYGRVG